MKRIACLVLALLLTACSSIVKMEGPQTVGERLTVEVPDAWNRLSAAGSYQPFDLWSQEGVALDQLRIWGGLASGETLFKVASGANVKPPVFTKGMSSEQMVGLVEALYALDGSMVQVSKVQPQPFAGVASGLNVQFSVVRKHDEVHLTGQAWLAVEQDRLYALAFTAPRLGFYPRLLPKAQAVASSARVRAR